MLSEWIRAKKNDIVKGLSRHCLYGKVHWMRKEVPKNDQYNKDWIDAKLRDPDLLSQNQRFPTPPERITYKGEHIPANIIKFFSITYKHIIAWPCYTTYAATAPTTPSIAPIVPTPSPQSYSTTLSFDEHKELVQLRQTVCTLASTFTSYQRSTEKSIQLCRSGYDDQISRVEQKMNVTVEKVYTTVKELNLF